MKHTKLFLISCMLTAMTVINTQGQTWKQIQGTDDIFKNPTDGNVGIGTQTPLQKVHIYNGFPIVKNSPPFVVGAPDAFVNNKPVAGIRIQNDFGNLGKTDGSFIVSSSMWDIRTFTGNVFQILKAPEINYTVTAGPTGPGGKIELISSGPAGPPTFSPVLTIINSGNVGIGTTTPSSPLTVAGYIESTNGGYKFPDGTIQATAMNPSAQWTTSGSDIYYGNGSVELRSNSGEGKRLKFIANGNNSDVANTGSWRISVAGASGSEDLRIHKGEGAGSRAINISSNGTVKIYSLPANEMVITDGNGNLSSQGKPVSSQWTTSGSNIFFGNCGSGANVGIGTTPKAGVKLAVYGLIKATEIICDVTNWCDYVFADNYKPMSLHELEKFILTNKHLPNIPTSEEVAENGLALSAMNSKLLQKVEELTLYVIEQNKKMEKMETDLSAVRKEIQEIKK